MNATHVPLVMHLDRHHFSIGESIRPQLEIQNRSSRNVVFGTGFAFDWERLAFAEPNAVHLIGADGDDLALPYRRDIEYFESTNPITVDAGKQEWLYLPISAHMQLRRPQRYSFWIELSDNGTNIHQSNKVTFLLSDVNYNASPGSVGLSLKPIHNHFHVGEPVMLEATFANKSEGEMIFLKPQEDSFYGWVNPVYRFVVTDTEGRSLALPLRSGSMAEPAYTENSCFLVKSGNDQRLALTLPKFLGINQPGEYRVRLTYIVRATMIGKGGDVLDKPMQWKDRTYIGRIESTEAAIVIS